MTSTTSTIKAFAIGTYVQANRPTCSCRNPNYELVEGTITKIIESASSSTIWYMLSSGKTIKHDWIIQ